MVSTATPVVTVRVRKYDSRRDRWVDYGIVAASTPWARLKGRIANGLRKVLSQDGAVVYTTVGKAYIVDVIDNTVATLAPFTGVGTGTNAAAAGDTDLQTAATEARASNTLSQPAADTNKALSADITHDGTKAITEAGLFSAAGSGSPPSGGTLIIRAVFSAINVVLNDKTNYDIRLQQT